jgi:hypothetical protein
MIQRAALDSPKLRFEAPEALEDSRQGFESSRQKRGAHKKLKVQSSKSKVLEHA